MSQQSSTDSCQAGSSNRQGQANLIVNVQTEEDIISGLSFTKYLIYCKSSGNVSWQFLTKINQNRRMRKMLRHYDRHYHHFLMWKDEKECVAQAIQVIDLLARRIGNGTFRYAEAIHQLRHKRGRRSTGELYFMFNVIQYLKAQMVLPSSYKSEAKGPFLSKAKYQLLADITQHAAEHNFVENRLRMRQLLSTKLFLYPISSKTIAHA